MDGWVSEIGRAPIGAASVVLDPNGRVLLVRHSYGRHSWEIPGGLALPRPFAEADVILH